LLLLLFSKETTFVEINSFVNKMNSFLMTQKYFSDKSKKLCRAQKLKCCQELLLLLFSKETTFVEINSFMNKMNSFLMTQKYFFHNNKP